ncbi:MAG TPA: PAS domain S-box protein, partial [Myxococcota bacterium]|nr:PAS domain S-box protein [Myxococcota bacterium]
MPYSLSAESWKNAFFQASNSVIVCLDTQGMLVELNNRAEHLLGVSRADLCGVDYVARFIPAELQAEVRADIQRVVEREGGCIVW